MKHGTLVYIAGPHSDPRGQWYVEQNIRAAEIITLELMRMGIATYCPHKQTQHMDGAITREEFILLDIIALSRCDALLTIPGWEDSAGASLEVEYAMRHGIEVLSWPQCMARLRELATNLQLAEGKLKEQALKNQGIAIKALGDLKKQERDATAA